MLRATPLRLALSACLLLALTLQSAAAKEGCKPKIDRNNVMVELQIEGLNGNQKLVFTMPVNGKKGVAGRGTGRLASQPGTPSANFDYTLDIVEEREGGAVVDLSVVATTQGGAVRTLKRTVFIPFEQIVERVFLGGVNMKAYFKMKPVSCHNISGQ
ncbi:MAG: hypothetical protein LC785_09265 [Acidobacteria bacterium]|nr:hypothetical protein [Acidobacteriota bacterium]MCA1642122.1 hypothetical protein [Acidobacteriota bacterium]